MNNSGESVAEYCHSAAGSQDQQQLLDSESDPNVFIWYLADQKQTDATVVGEQQSSGFYAFIGILKTPSG